MNNALLSLLSCSLLAIPCAAQNDLLPAYPREIQYQGGPDGTALFGGRPFTGLLVDEKSNTRLGVFQNGKKQGTHVTLWPNGKKQTEGDYSDNRRIGEHKHWHATGSLRVSYTYTNDGIADGQYILFSQDGLKERTENYQRGKLISTGVYKGNDLFEDVLEYYPNGQTKRRQGTLKNGLPDGTWLEWHENNEVQSEASFIDGKRSGIMKTYWPNRERRREEEYSDGNLIRIIYANDVDPAYSVWGVKKPNSKVFMCTMNVAMDTLFIIADIEEPRSGATLNAIRSLRSNILGALELRLQPLDGNMLMQYGRRRVTHSITISELQVTPVYDDGKTTTTGVLGTMTTQTSPGYRARATCKLVLIEHSIGKTLVNAKLTAQSSIYSTKDQALAADQTAIRSKISDQTYRAFRILAPLGNVIEYDRKGQPKRIRVACGAEYNLGKGFEFHIVTMPNHVRIARVEVREISSGSSECVVKEGADVLQVQLGSSTVLMALSAY